MRIAYTRVSSSDQNEERQLEALKDCGIEKWFSEKVSGKDMNRPLLQGMLDYAREGDTLYVEDFSRKKSVFCFCYHNYSITQFTANAGG